MEWKTVEKVLRQGIESGAAPGLVAVFGDESGIIHETVLGTRDVANGVPMTSDTIFRIASHTKQVNAIAVLQLVAAGSLSLDTPVGDIIPDFDKVKVVIGWDGDVPQLRQPRIRATVRHLMTHTSGLTYDVLHPQALRYLQATGVPMPSSGELRCFESPMIAEPGTEWNYGMSADWTGRVVEAASGETLDVYYLKHIFEPLGLVDIGFDLTAQQRTRLAPVYRRDASGQWNDDHFAWVDHPEFLSAGHGLYATAQDFFAIQQVLLRKGEYRGVRLVNEDLMASMLSDQMMDIPVRTMKSGVPPFSEDMWMPDGATWGLDIMVTRHGEPGMRHSGSGGWAGTFNTFFWVDPHAHIAAGLYMQTLPFFDHPALACSQAFEAEVYRQMVTP